MNSVNARLVAVAVCELFNAIRNQDPVCKLSGSTVSHGPSLFIFLLSVFGRILRMKSKKMR